MSTPTSSVSLVKPSRPVSLTKSEIIDYPAGTMIEYSASNGYFPFGTVGRVRKMSTKDITLTNIAFPYLVDFPCMDGCLGTFVVAANEIRRYR